MIVIQTSLKTRLYSLRRRGACKDPVARGARRSTMLEPAVKDRSLAACLALSLGLTILVGREVLFAGKTFVPAEFLTSREPWGPPGATDAHLRNWLHQDIVEFNAVHATAAARSLKEEGRLLLWNPDLLCGVPAMGDPQVGTFHPLRILLYRALPPFAALDLFVLIHFFAAGPAMSRDEALAALAVGLDTAAELVADGHDLLLTGDMGIGNTT
ncbi:MAG: nicotinate-nucleotide--dimethylbenzimidazole phosphoribosyltransferase, partial [Planctomycetota bacterium]